ncbi:hypothetical protein HPB51_024356 [Rhipicephalus microplus]|uniref:Uncharacterized protein n=1 Tax=Rhipicephalus microplus TaxID=6941 RepID=A0A9J6D741_RHIMP|nr:hypothetical protein HPB51_024356 [Rhipicephalus microplus]
MSVAISPEKLNFPLHRGLYLLAIRCLQGLGRVRSRGDELRNNRKGAPAARLVFQQSLATHPASESFHFLSGITPRVRQGYDAATELSETTATVQPPFSTLRFVDDAVLRTPAIFYLYRSAAQRGTP